MLPGNLEDSTANQVSDSQALFAQGRLASVVSVTSFDFGPIGMEAEKAAWAFVPCCAHHRA